MSQKTNNQLVKFIANSYWSESNRNRYATWPRLSTTSVANNKELSTWFMRDGSFLRLKLVELGYTVPQKIGYVQSEALYVFYQSFCFE